MSEQLFCPLHRQPIPCIDCKFIILQSRICKLESKLDAIYKVWCPIKERLQIDGTVSITDLESLSEAID